MPQTSENQPDKKTKRSYNFNQATHDRIKEIARMLDVPIDQLARYLMDYALAEYEAGRLSVPIEELPADELPPKHRVATK